MFSWTVADPFRIKAERTSVTGRTDGGGGGRGASEQGRTKAERERESCQRTVSGSLRRWGRWGGGLWTIANERVGCVRGVASGLYPMSRCGVSEGAEFLHLFKQGKLQN